MKSNTDRMIAFANEHGNRCYAMTDGSILVECTFVDRTGAVGTVWYPASTVAVLRDILGY